MRILRPLLLALACLAGVALLLLALAFSPPVQEWATKRLITSSSGAEVVALGSASIGFSSVSVENLQLRRGQAILSVPAATARLPVKTAWWGGPMVVESLSARGWTLDLSGQESDRASRPGTSSRAFPASAPARASPGPAASPTSGTSALSPAAERVHRWLRQRTVGGVWKSLDLEGDVLLPSGEGGTRNPMAVHLLLKGGELAPGKTAAFTFDGTTGATGAFRAVRAQGRLIATVNAGGGLDRLAFDGRAAPEGVRIPADLQVAAEIAFSNARRDERYRMKVVRGEREVVRLEANSLPAAARLAGHWRVDLRNVDLATLAGTVPFPLSAAAGEGEFDAAGTLGDWRVAGHLEVALPPPALHLPNPGALRTLPLAATFDLSRDAGTLRLNRLDIAVTGPQPVGHLHAAQSCRFDSNGRVTPSDADADFLVVTLEALPLAWFSRSTDPIGFLDGSLAGQLAVKVTADGLSIRSTTSLAAKQVSLRLPGTVPVEGLDLSTRVTAGSHAGKGWTVHAAPLSLVAAGHPLMTGDATVNTAVDAYGRVPVTGTWKADLAGWTAGRGAGATRSPAGGELSGEFTANVGAAGDLRTRFTLVGSDPQQTIRGTIEATVDDYNRFTLRAPLHFTVGTDVADVSIEGKWALQNGAHRVDLQVSSNRIGMNHLRLLTGRFAARARMPADERPFWSPLVGRIRFDVRQFTGGDREFWDLGGTLGLEPNTLQLTGGRARFLPQPVKADRSQLVDLPVEPASTYALEGLIAFDPASPGPYRLNATAGVDVLTTRRLLGWRDDSPDPLVEGHWSVHDAVTASGATLADLLAHRREEFHLESTGGALRLLRTNIGDAIPDEATPIADTLATIGSAAGRIFGRRGNTLAGQRKLGKETEALLNLTYQTREIAFEKVVLTAACEPDGTLRLSDLAITAPNERLTGTGTIAFAPDQPLRRRPLSLTLELAFRGVAAERLAMGGLLQAGKDADGFAHLRQPVRFGGTLDQVDNREWHDLLAKAVTAVQRPR